MDFIACFSYVLYSVYVLVYDLKPIITIYYIAINSVELL